MTCTSQSEWFISVQCRYSPLKYVYNIGSFGFRNNFIKNASKLPEKKNRNGKGEKVLIMQKVGILFQRLLETSFRIHTHLADTFQGIVCHDQCDQLLEQKVAQCCLKCSPMLPLKQAQQFLLKNDVFKIAQKVAKYLAQFCKKICTHSLLEIVQSGHIGHDLDSLFPQSFVSTSFWH